MNEIYGIDPKAPSNITELSALIRLFLPSEGRFIADFPMGWSVEMREHMSSISDLSRMASVEAWIKLAGHGVLPIKQHYKSSLSWSENASYINGFVSKLIGPSHISKNPIQPLDKVLNDPDFLQDSRSAFIPRTASSYAEISAPILLKSRKVVLIDPFISFRYKTKYSDQWQTDRRKNVVKAMLKIAMEGKYLECFEIFHVLDEEKESGSFFLQQDMSSLVNELGFDKLLFAVRQIKKDGNTKQHARYLLGLNSGLHFDHGFDTSDDGSKNHVDWMSQSVLLPLLEKFT